MKDTIQKFISLGLGVVVASKEQIEKTVDELVKKGEVGREESKGLVEELMRKGAEARSKIESMAQEKASAIVGENRYATREELAAKLAAVELRLAALEEKMRQAEA